MKFELSSNEIRGLRDALIDVQFFLNKQNKDYLDLIEKDIVPEHNDYFKESIKKNEEDIKKYQELLNKITI